MAAPIPRVPPVTNATRPAMETSLKLLWATTLRHIHRTSHFRCRLPTDFPLWWEIENVGRLTFQAILPTFPPPPPLRITALWKAGKTSVADHLRLARQAHRLRQQDDQHLQAEDGDRGVEAGLGAPQSANQRAEPGAERPRGIGENVDGADRAEQARRRHRLAQRGRADHPQD